ncbi:MAG: hypothetical protein KGK06_05155, partial [Xanthomonadaceae bacterium]|nr:hypothetical protein [Xanthomonadaceae bacterium]
MQKQTAAIRGRLLSYPWQRLSYPLRIHAKAGSSALQNGVYSGNNDTRTGNAVPGRHNPYITGVSDGRHRYQE